MDINQRHSAMLSNPIEFSQPDFRCLLLQQYEKCEVLRKRIRDLNIAPRRTVDNCSFKVNGAAVWVWHPEWEDSVTAVGLRLKWVRIKGRRVVLNIEIVQPIEIT